MATVTQILDPLSARVFTTVQAPELVQSNGTAFPVAGYAFDGAGATVEAIYFETFAANYGASNPNVVILVEFYTSATANATVWQAALAKVTPGAGVSVLTKAFATAVAASAVTSSGTANAGLRATITISGASLDGMTASDVLFVKLFRDPANGGDTNTADAVATSVEVQYSDT